MHSTNFVHPSGLDTTEAMASFDVIDLASASYIVNAMIGTLGIVLLITDVASIPLIPGITKSITMRSGFNYRAFVMASTPSAASPHTT